MTVAALIFEVNWNGDGVTWTDESANVRTIKAQRGRDYASALTGRAQAGELIATLLNVSQRYSDFNASSPLFGLIVPGRKVRWRATSPVARTLWQGFLSDPQPEASERGEQTYATLRCSGPLWWVAEQESATALQATIDSGAAAGKVLDDAGWPAADRVIDTGQVALVDWKADQPSAGTDPKKALVYLQELEEAEMGFLSESADGKIVFEDAHHRLKSPHTASQATFSDAAAAALPYERVAQLSPWKQIFNRFVAEVTPSTNGAPGATLWTLSGETPSIGPGASKSFTAVYPAAGAANGSAFVRSWSTPTLTANSAADGSGTDLTGQISIATVKAANTMQITLTNNAAVVAHITQLFATGTPASFADATRIEVTDATSISKYGRRTYPLGSRLYPTLKRAQDFCEWGLSRYKDPQPLLELSYQADMNADLMTQALTRDISERITVIASGTTPAGAQLGINADFFIEAVAYEYDLQALLVTYRLSFAGSTSIPGDGGYWVIGISTLGETTRLVV